MVIRNVNVVWDKKLRKLCRKYSGEKKLGEKVSDKFGKKFQEKIFICLHFEFQIIF
jgi:hypothetical protein